MLSRKMYQNGTSQLQSFPMQVRNFSGVRFILMYYCLNFCKISLYGASITLRILNKPVG